MPYGHAIPIIVGLCTSRVNETKQNQLAEELHKPIIKKLYKGIRFLLCLINIFSKYAWVVPLKGKKPVTIVNAFQSILNDSKRKPNKIWVDKGSEFYNISMKSRIENK